MLASPPNTLWAFLWYFVKPFKWWYVFITLAALIWGANEVLFAFFIKLIVDQLTQLPAGSDVWLALKWPLLALVTVWGVMELAMRIQGFMLRAVMPRFRAHVRESVFAYVQQHSHRYYSERFAGKIANKLTDMPESSERILEILLISFIPIIFALIIAFNLLWHTSPYFAGIMLVWLVVHVGALIAFSPYCNRLFAAHADAVSTLSGKLVDCFSNIMNVRLFARRRFEQDYFHGFQQDEINKARKAWLYIELMRIIQGLGGLFLIFFMTFTLIQGWQQGWVSLGDFTLIAMLSFGMLGLVWWLSFQTMHLYKEIGTLSAALSLIVKPLEVVDSANAVPLVVKQGDIVFDQVGFYYQENHQLFKDKSEHIRGGEKVGLVGFSGAGKSTFVNLMMRFYDVDSGAILIDQQNIKQVTLASLSENISMIPQDTTLFHRTLMENIRYGRLDASDEEVIAAAKRAHCHEFIMRLPQAYDALVGERGIKLSTGQRQRIAIARAILKNAPILILDEATASLDSVTEKLIQTSLLALMQGKTTIVIAHRLSTLAQMDRILVFDQGRVIEQGTQAELLAAGGHFAQLWQMQVDGFLPDKA